MDQGDRDIVWADIDGDSVAQFLWEIDKDLDGKQNAVNPESSMGSSNGPRLALYALEENGVSEGFDPSGRVGGTLSIPSDKEDTQHEPEGFNDHSGTARTSESNQDNDGGGDGGQMVNVARLIEQFELIKAQELKPRSRKEYIYVFRRFANFINLEKRTKRDLRDRGRKYLLDYLRKAVPKKSWKKTRSGLQTFWEDILELEWPLRRSDIKIRTKTGRGYTPTDSVILEWANSLKHERDPFLRLVWLMIIQHGWRPSHIGGIRWKHIQRDKNNVPMAIVAYPENGEFKTEQPVAVNLVPDVRETLMEWEKETIEMRGEIDPEGLVLPWRSRAIKTGYEWNRPYDFNQGIRIWNDLRRRYRLPKLTPRDCRHWVSTACRKAGLSKAATAYLQGHDSSGGSTMRDWYDNPTEQDAIQEQATVLPHGPLGTLLQPEVKVEGDIPDEAKALFQRYLTGELGSIELITELENLRRVRNETAILKP